MENVEELKPSEIFIVNIRHIRNMHGYDYLHRTIAKAFSSEEKAKEALVDMGFVYGKPYPFHVAGWYHKKQQKHPNFDLYDIFDYIEADIECAEIDKRFKSEEWNFFRSFTSGDSI